MKYIAQIIAMLLVLAFTEATAYADQTVEYAHGEVNVITKVTQTKCKPLHKWLRPSRHATIDHNCIDLKDMQQDVEGIGEVRCNTMRLCEYDAHVASPNIGYTGQWNRQSSTWDFIPVVPEELRCGSETTCEGSPPSAHIIGSNVLGHIEPTCWLLDPDHQTDAGICLNTTAWAEYCPSGITQGEYGTYCIPPTQTQPNQCLSDIECYNSGMICHNQRCILGYESDFIGDGDACIDDGDCLNSMWGAHCVGDPGASHCNECSPLIPGMISDGVAEGCPGDLPYCGPLPFWRQHFVCQ